jgi:dUTPase
LRTVYRCEKKTHTPEVIKMVKRLCVSFPEWVYTSYLNDCINKSGFVVENFLLGIDTNYRGEESAKIIVINQRKEITELREKIKQLQQIIAKHESTKNDENKKKKTIKKESSYIRSLINQGMLRDAIG